MIVYCPRCGAQFAQEFRGASFETSIKCSDCGVASADPPAMLVPSDGEVTYGLDEWPVVDRVTLTGALTEEDVPYRWEAGVVLCVPQTVEGLVDGILDDLERSPGEGVEGSESEDGDAADEPPDGGEEAHAAMTELFVLADRLQHVPADIVLVEELATVADVAAASLPPYGIGAPAWRRINDLAAAVGDAEDDLEVIEAAVALRDYLRPMV